jgi:hypothetical protein
VQVQLFGNKLPTAHTALSAAFIHHYIQLLAMVMNNVVILCGQRRNEGNGAMETARYWQQRDDACSDVKTSANTPRFLYTRS